MRCIRFFLIGLFLLLQGVPVLAAELKTDAALRQLYLQQIQSTRPDSALDERIAAERQRARRELLRELSALVDATNNENEKTATDTVAVVAKQKALVENLQAQRQEAKVDRDLLLEEQSTLDSTIETGKGTVLQGAVRRKAETLSQMAVLEEKIAALDDVLSQQQDRLQRLTAQERTAAFVGVVRIGFYLGVLVLIIVVERFVRRQLIARIHDRNRRYLLTKMFTGCVYIILVAWMLYRLAADYPGAATSFAIVGAGIAVALQPMIKDVAGWIVIMQKRLFRLGQRVTIGPYTGDVADISLLRTTIVEVMNAQTLDIGRVGQTLHIPNSLVLEQPVLNFHATSDFMEGEIPVTVTYGSDWKRAGEILRQILQEEVGEYVERARRQHMHRTAHFFASQEPPEPRVFTDIAADGILFTLRFQVPIGQRRTLGSRIASKVLERFSQEKIVLAYKTVQVIQ
jgi:small-conductance mechanosensitive channel